MKNTKTSLILNIIIFAFVLIATIFMYAGIEFMGHAALLTAESVKMLQFYTVQSNLLIGIIAGVMAIYEILYLNNKIKRIPNIIYLLKLIFTVGVSITLFVVVFYLAPITGKNAPTLFMNSNLFFHLLVPILAIVSFIFFEKTNEIKFKYLTFAILPTLLYGIYYAINAYSHVENGKIDIAYDWYGFAQAGIIGTIIVFIVVIGLSYLFGWLLWMFNRKNSNKAH